MASFLFPGTGHEWNRKEIGFVGDKTFYQIPYLNIIQKEQQWKWIEKQGSRDWEDWKLFYTPEHKCSEFWDCIDMSTDSMLADPRMFYLPTPFQAFCAAQPHNHYDLFLFVETVAQDKGLIDQDVVLI